MRGGRRVYFQSGKGRAAWQRQIRRQAVEVARSHRDLPTDDAVAAVLLFRLPRPKSAPRTIPRTRELAATGFDLDKLCRAAFDALEGPVLKNDARATGLVAFKRVVYGGATPGLEITVHYGDEGKAWEQRLLDFLAS